MRVGLGDLGRSDYLFWGFWVLLTATIRWRFQRQRDEMRPLVRRVGEFVTWFLVAAPVLVVIAALTGRLETTP